MERAFQQPLRQSSPFQKMFKSCAKFRVWRAASKIQVIMTILLGLLASLNISSANKTYHCPYFCECATLPTRYDAVQLVCKLFTSTSTMALTDIPVPKTTWLTVACRSDHMLYSRTSPPPEIPPGIFNRFIHLEKLLISNCMYKDVPKSTFEGMQSLIVLNIKNIGFINGYVPFEANTFDTTPMMKILDLSFNNLTSRSLPPALFCSLKELEILRLDGNLLDSSSTWGIDCLGQNMTTMPHLKELYVCENYFLGTLQGANLASVPNLEKLDLHMVNITKVPENFLKDMHKLKWLDFSNNAIGFEHSSSPHVPSFCNMTKLVHLNLADNYLHNLPDDFSPCLQNLQYLNLSVNNFIEFTISGSMELNNLLSLDLSFNKLIIPPDLQVFPNLQMLNLTNNQLQDLDNSTFSYTNNLQILLLGKNNIRHLHKAVLQEIRRLSVLNISYNGLLSLDNDIFLNNERLQTLDLSDNKIQVIPTSLHFKSMLSYMDMSRNSLKSVSHKDMIGLQSLLGVSFSHNCISHLESYLFRNSPQLYVINLAYNNITLLEINLFDVTKNVPLRYLTHLKLSGNTISDVGLTFSRLPALAVLMLDHNQIKKIHAGSFPPNIQQILLNNNKLQQADANSFINLEMLQIVNLTYNNFRVIPKESVAVSKLLRFRPNFLIKGNPFDCHCENAWMTVTNTKNFQSGLPQIADLQYTFCMQKRNFETKIYWLNEIEGKHMYCNFSDCPELCSCLRNYDHTRNEVFCDRRNLTKIPQVSPLFDTSHFHLSGNSISTVGADSFMNIPNVQVIYLNNSGILIIEKNAFENMLHLRILHLNDNMLVSLHALYFSNMRNLQEFYIQNNMILTINLKSFTMLSNMHTIFLNNNNITKIDTEAIRNSSLFRNQGKLQLGHNPWSCDCDFVVTFKNWVKEHSAFILDKENIQVDCKNHTNSTSSNLIYLDLRFCTPASVQQVDTMFKQNKDFITVLAVLGSLFLFSIIAALVIFKYRQNIKVWVFSKYGLRFHTPSEDGNKPFDGFISYSSKDEQILVETIVPTLENAPFNYNLCVHYRDWPVGASIAESIISSVDSSKRTLILLSQNFVDSEWCSYEFRAAHHRLLQDNKQSIIVIMLDENVPHNMDSELKLFLQTNTYLKWGDPWFWEKLKYAMPVRRTTCESNNPEKECANLHYLHSHIDQINSKCSV